MLSLPPWLAHNARPYQSNQTEISWDHEEWSSLISVMIEAMQPFDKETEQYVADGFLCRERIFSEQECFQLLAQMISEWKSKDRMMLTPGKPKFRFSCRAEYNELSSMMIRKTLSQYKNLIKMYFADEDLILSELTSLCIFPGAKRQLLHIDFSDPCTNVITFFINLFNVDEDCGPLAVAPGYHQDKDKPEVINSESMQKILLPAGSCVAMDSRVPHCGMQNKTVSSVKPIIYFSIGDPGLDGPYGKNPLRINVNHLYRQWTGLAIS